MKENISSNYDAKLRELPCKCNSVKCFINRGWFLIYFLFPSGQYGGSLNITLLFFLLAGYDKIFEKNITLPVQHNIVRKKTRQNEFDHSDGQPQHKKYNRTKHHLQ